MSTRDDVVEHYLRYLDACNRRAWDELPAFLARTVLTNGEPLTRREYVADIEATTAVFPDYRWEVRRTVWDGEWLAVHLHDSGTRAQPFLDAPGDGAHVETEEFAMYRIADGCIHELEGTADNARLSR